MSVKWGMTKEELLTKLRWLADGNPKRSRSGGQDVMLAHEEADRLLLEFIGDAEITAVYGDIDKWYD